MDRGGTSDPFVILKCAGQTKQTAVVPKSLAPTWGGAAASYAFDVYEGAVLVLDVYDHDALSANDFMGRMTLPLAELEAGAAAMTRWFDLGPKGRSSEANPAEAYVPVGAEGRG